MTEEGYANFAVFSDSAKEVFICLFSPERAIPLKRGENGVWSVAISGLGEGATYAYRIEGRLLSDPYTLVPYSNDYTWGDFLKTPRGPFLSRVEKNQPFDWEGVSSPGIPLADLVIYEMHVRGFTMDPTSKATSPGTYAGIIEKIPYLKKLGINAVELMPIFEFDETNSRAIDPATGRRLPNYWGYHPISFFLPMSRYAKKPEDAVREFKTMVRELHRAGIEVFLDVVYNHTGEDQDHILSFAGIDKASYYLLDPKGRHLDYTGCGNTFQANSAAGMRVILDSLHYFVKELHIDGFRFDLAAALTRGNDGEPLGDAPFLQAIAKDPVLQSTKLIAEPWDAAGLYELGQFPRWGHWSSWNGHFRDHVRRFMKGTTNEAGTFATAICGSQPCYSGPHSPLSSINFVTAHDGFTLRDLVSYQDKHNLGNGENNRDGSNNNESWNCGAEGPTTDPQILELRERQMRNFFLALFLSQGIPMMFMGDEIGHTRKGNNNGYPQDNEINWFSWKTCDAHQAMFQFVSSLIAFRKSHSQLRRSTFLTSKDIDWHGSMPFQPDWSPASRLVAYTLKGSEPLYIAFHAGYENRTLTLPPNRKWHQVVNTAEGWDQHHFDRPGKILSPTVEMIPYSTLVASGHS
jgi:isoamylase/glycogen operon protein